MREWLKRVVLKTTVPETVPGVRIPLPPPIVPFFAMRCEHSRELGWALKIPQMKAVCNGFVMVCSCWRVLFGCLCTSEMIYLSLSEDSVRVLFFARSSMERTNSSFPAVYAPRSFGNLSASRRFNAEYSLAISGCRSR